jgi:Uma2 family endonuclease
MAVQVERHLFTLEEYERMVEASVFGEDKRLELIRGEILERTPIGCDHAGIVARLTMLLAKMASDSAIVWVQNPIQLAGNSRPEPDLALLKWQDYGSSRPATAADVFLIIEVADTTLNYDHAVKGPLYTEAGISEYWIVNLADQLIEVYSKPSGGTYKQTRNARRGDAIRLPVGLEAPIEVSDILGKTSKGSPQTQHVSDRKMPEC